MDRPYEEAEDLPSGEALVRCRPATSFLYASCRAFHAQLIRPGKYTRVQLGLLEARKLVGRTADLTSVGPPGSRDLTK